MIFPKFFQYRFQGYPCWIEGHLHHFRMVAQSFCRPEHFFMGRDILITYLGAITPGIAAYINDSGILSCFSALKNSPCQRQCNLPWELAACAGVIELDVTVFSIANAVMIIIEAIVTAIAVFIACL